MSELLRINVNEHVEKKNGLTYLSWAWAWAEVLKIDQAATWAAHENAQGLPVIVLPDESCMVKVSVTIKGDTKTCLLPVMDHRNKAIKGPDAFSINTAIMRCLAKAIAMHGLGLYIYAGEDLPEEPSVAISPVKEAAKVSGAMLTDDRKAELDEAALVMIETFNSANSNQSLHTWREITDNDERVYVWSRFASESKLRAFLKANAQKVAA